MKVYPSLGHSIVFDHLNGKQIAFSVIFEHAACSLRSRSSNRSVLENGAMVSLRNTS